MIQLELSEELQGLEKMMRKVAKGVMRPISRKYDRQEHAVPEELEMLRGTRQSSREKVKPRESENTGVRNGINMRGVVSTMQLCWGDTGLLLSIPGRGLGNAAINAVGTPEQKERFGKLYASMAITEPSAGSDSANISTTAVRDGDHFVLNGEKIFVTAGDRCNAVVVWATLDKSLGRAAIKSFIVEKGTPGMEVVKLEHKLGIRASDTATIRFENCRIPKENLLGSAEIADAKKSFGGVMQTFDNTRPAVAAMAIGVSRAALDLTYELLEQEDIRPTYERTPHQSHAIQADLYRMEADWEAARLLTLRAAWMADNRQPNSKQASMAKAKAGRVGNEITLRCVEICGSLGYSEEHLLEKFARDSKILDIFEGTQQIQQLIVARRVLGLGSAQLK